MTMFKARAVKKLVSVTEMAGHSRRAAASRSSAPSHSDGGGK